MIEVIIHDVTNPTEALFEGEIPFLPSVGEVIFLNDDEPYKVVERDYTIKSTRSHCSIDVKPCSLI